MTTETHSHARRPIPVRRMDFVFSPDIPENWADDNPVLTALLAGLSAVFPPGERYFIASVRRYVGQIDDPELRERVRGFIGQEANHTKEHIAFNEFLDARGLPILAMQRFVEKAIARVEAKNSPAQNLARTAALEHMTAFLATALLEYPELLDRVHPQVAALWAWHAIEEIEHRSVAFDVYKQCVGDEWLRIRTMATVTVIFASLTTLRTVLVLRANGSLFDLPAWAGAIDVLFGRVGVLRRAMPLYRAYYRRNFHPDEYDNDRHVDRARDEYLGALA